VPQTQAQKEYNARRTAARRGNAPAAPPKSYQETVAGRRETYEYQAEIRKLMAERDDLARQLDRFVSVDARDLIVPAWITPKARRGIHYATPVLMLSDLHLDEVVDFGEMDGMNSYDRATAERRLSRIVDFTVEFAKHYTSGLAFEGIVVALLGDILTGIIHAELAETNEATPTESIVYWVPRLAAALTHLADEFGQVFVPTVDGNHDRTTQKTRAKKRTQSSYAWVLYNWLADTVRHDDRISFRIAVAPEQIIKVHETRFLLTHGDGFRSAGGVGGIYPSMLKFLHRKHELYARAGKAWDIALMGHWHQLLFGPDFIVNGSLKGYDEYAKGSGFGFELPRQALFVVTPERGVTVQTAVYAESWRAS
jgi:predicted phosphodiesterase